MKTRRNLLIVLGAGALARPFAALAQQPARVWRIGLLYQSRRESFVELNRPPIMQGLLDHGYVEGKNLIIEARFGEDKLERLPDLAAELVRLKVDLIIVTSTPPALAAKQATATIPIVMVGVADPVGSGLATSLARPGGNLTGITNLSRELAAKQVDLLTDLIPKISRIAVMRNPANASSLLQLKEIESAVRARGLQFQLFDVGATSELESAFAAMGKSNLAGLVVLPDAMYTSARQKMAELAIKNRVASVYARGVHTDAGALVAYGPSLTDDYIRVGSYVDRIFKGAKPAELPIQQPTKLELVVNMKTAKALGLTIPQSILVRADRVIE